VKLLRFGVVVLLLLVCAGLVLVALLDCHGDCTPGHAGDCAACPMACTHALRSPRRADVCSADTPDQVIPYRPPVTALVVFSFFHPPMDRREP
jgi:hypothetical protein